MCDEGSLLLEDLQKMNLTIQLYRGRTFQTERKPNYKGPWIEDVFGMFKIYKEANMTAQN